MKEKTLYVISEAVQHIMNKYTPAENNKAVQNEIRHALLDIEKCYGTTYFETMLDVVISERG